MKIDFDDLLGAFSYALDCIEHDVLGATTNHSKRVAYVSCLIGQKLEFSDSELTDLAACAMLHDNALSQYMFTAQESGVKLTDKKSLDLKPHCIFGEENMKNVPLDDYKVGTLMYHHENADGSGIFGKTADETPMFAQIIHIADSIDVAWPFADMTDKRYTMLRMFVKNNVDRLYSKICADTFLDIFTQETHKALRGCDIDTLLPGVLPRAVREYDNNDIKKFAGMFARIIDYKSDFTMHHSLGIAEKAEAMAKFYGYSHNMVTEMYFTGAVHDLGKLVISRDILEKPAKLTDIEYKNIQNHAYATYEILSKVKGLEEITHWASLHHERLNGKGYPFGKKADELDFNDRLMACLDVYQALREKRPYKDEMTHDSVMKILRNMANTGFLDAKITEDIGTALRES